MPSSLPKAQLSTEAHSLDHVRTRMVKASPAPSMAVQAGPSSWTEVLKDGLIEACGKLHAAAVQMEMDPSQLSRDLQSGAFQLKRLDKLNPQERAVVVRRMNQAFLDLMDPKEYASRLIDRMQGELNELRQFISEVA